MKEKTPKKKKIEVEMFRSERPAIASAKLSDAFKEIIVDDTKKPEWVNKHPELNETENPDWDIHNNTPDMIELKDNLDHGIIPEDWSHFSPAMTQLVVDTLREVGLMTKTGIPVPAGPDTREKFLQLYKDKTGASEN